MNIRSARHLLLTLVVAGATLASAASAQPWQEKRATGTSSTLRVDFGRSLHWTSIPGTRVEELPMSERPRYDVFRYGGSYYAFDNDRWYMSARERGDFQEIDDRNVPDEFTAISREHWRNYPTRWHGRSGLGDRDYSDAVPATLQVRVANSARWYAIRGTSVKQLRGAQRPDFDLFRLGGEFYAFDNDNWYMSRRASAQYRLINERQVPAEMTWVPRYAWQHYPDRWLDDRGRLRNDRGRPVAGNRWGN
jgi:hypothetical protein